jgi:hypothetical protein
MTATEIRDLITLYLQDASSITAAEHKSIENALVDYMEATRTQADNLALTILAGVPKNVGYITGVNPPVSSGVVSSGGNITTATGTASGILCTMTNAMPSTNYVVKMNVQSLGNYSSDGTVKCPMFKVVSTTQFYFFIHETDNLTQNLKIHFEIKSLD